MTAIEIAYKILFNDVDGMAYKSYTPKQLRRINKRMKQMVTSF